MCTAFCVGVCVCVYGGGVFAYVIVCVVEWVEHCDGIGSSETKNKAKNYK